MSESRADKLQRLVRVQRQIERMAENDLSLTLRESARVDEAREALIEAIGSLEPIHQALTPLYTRRFTGLETKSQRLGEIRQMLEQRVLKERTKADRLADSARDQAEIEAREADDEKLLDLIDTLMASRTGSSPA